MRLREVESGIPNGTKWRTLNVPLDTNLGSLSEPKAEESAGVIPLPNHRILLWRLTGDGLQLQEQSLYQDLPDHGLRIRFENARCLGLTVAPGVGGRLSLLIPTTAALFALPLESAGLREEGILNSVTLDRVLDRNHWSELAGPQVPAQLNPIKAAAAIDSRGVAHFALAYSNASILLAQLPFGSDQELHTSLIRLNSGHLLSRITQRLYAPSAAEEERSSAVGLLFLGPGSRLLSLSRDARLRLFATKEAQEKGSLDLAPTLFDLNADQVDGDERLTIGVVEQGTSKSVVGITAVGIDNVPKVLTVHISGQYQLSLGRLITATGSAGFLLDVGWLPNHSALLLCLDAASRPKLHVLSAGKERGSDNWDPISLIESEPAESGDLERLLGSGEEEGAARLLASTFTHNTLAQALALVSPESRGLDGEVWACLLEARASVGRQAQNFWTDLWRYAAQFHQEEMRVLGVLSCSEQGLAGLVRKGSFTLLAPCLTHRPDTPMPSQESLAAISSLRPYTEARPHLSQGPTASLSLDEFLLPEPDEELMDSGDATWSGVGNIGAGFLGSALVAELESRQGAAVTLASEGAEAWDLALETQLLLWLAGTELPNGERLISALFRHPTSPLRRLIAANLGQDTNSWLSLAEGAQTAALALLFPHSLLQSGAVPQLLCESGAYSTLSALCSKLETLKWDNELELRHFFTGLANLYQGQLDSAMDHFGMCEGSVSKAVVPRPAAPFSGEVVASPGQLWLELAQLGAGRLPSVQTLALVRRGLSAAETGDPAEARLELLLFEFLLDGGEYQEAILLMSRMKDLDAQDNCLRQLLVTLLESGKTQELVSLDLGAFSAPAVRILQHGLRLESGDQLLLRAMSISTASFTHFMSSAESTSSIGLGASWCYEWAQRLVSDVGGKEGMKRAAAALANAARALLDITDQRDRFILGPSVSHSAQDEETAEPPQAFQLTIIRHQDIERQLIALECRCELAGEAGGDDEELLDRLLAEKRLSAACRLVVSRTDTMHFAPVLNVRGEVRGDGRESMECRCELAGEAGGDDEELLDRLLAEKRLSAACRLVVSRTDTMHFAPVLNVSGEVRGDGRESMECRCELAGEAGGDDEELLDRLLAEKRLSAACRLVVSRTDTMHFAPVLNVSGEVRGDGRESMECRCELAGEAGGDDEELLDRLLAEKRLSAACRLVVSRTDTMHFAPVLNVSGEVRGDGRESMECRCELAGEAGGDDEELLDRLLAEKRLSAACRLVVSRTDTMHFAPVLNVSGEVRGDGRESMECRCELAGEAGGDDEELLDRLLAEKRLSAACRLVVSRTDTMHFAPVLNVSGEVRGDGRESMECRCELAGEAGGDDEELLDRLLAEKRLSAACRLVVSRTDTMHFAPVLNVSGEVRGDGRESMECRCELAGEAGGDDEELLDRLLAEKRKSVSPRPAALLSRERTPCTLRPS